MTPLTSALAKELLRGKRKPIVWGRTADLTLTEWQRQIPASFIVDTQWGLWNLETCHGLPVCSPSQIERIPPARALVMNNYAHSAGITDKIEDYIGRIGGHPVSGPLSLLDLVHATLPSPPQGRPLSPKDLAEINKKLKQLLIQPHKLQASRALPSLQELQKFFGLYTRESYLDAALDRLRQTQPLKLRPRDGHVALLIGSLDYGGAERQICNLAVGLKRAGWTPRVFCQYDVPNGKTRYIDFLNEHGIAYQLIPTPRAEVPPNLKDLMELSDDVRLTLWHLPPSHSGEILQIAKALRTFRPELLISYLDMNNTTGGLAGVLAGVPKIQLSGRNEPPTHMAHLYDARGLAFFETGYRFVLGHQNVVFSNNSSYGAKTYAQWLGFPPEKITVIPNCVTEDFLRPMPASALKACRKKLGLDEKTPLILGVFRLAKEKDPLTFVRAIAALAKRHPRVKAVICGQGPMEKQIRRLITKLKLENALLLAGVVEDIPALMRTATLLLHTAKIEGSPNVILEAQASGLPIVCTNNGGTREFLADAWKPYMTKTGDAAALAEHMLALLSNKKKSREAAENVRRVAKQETACAKLTARTLAASGLAPKGKSR